MADMNFERFEGNRRASGEGLSRKWSHLINLAGAATSVALVLGLAVWGYKLAVRDVSGIPVVLALEGPMRVTPEDPGGTVADNQGLAVNAISAEDTSAAPSEQLVLAPRAVELSVDDAPGLAALTAEPAADQLDTLLEPAVAIEPAAPEALEADDGVDQSAIDQALAAALAEGGDLTALPSEDPAATAAASGVARSLRPLARPGLVSTAAEPPPSDVSAVQDVVSVPSPEMQPEEVQVGARLVQLGAFDTADDARAEWTRLQGSFGDLMAGKAIIVQPAESGGQTFYRLRAFGFSDEDDARRFCSALLSEDTACIPVTQR